MTKTVLKISLDSELRDKIAAAAKGNYVSISAWLTGAATAALPKPITAKPLSVAEQKAAHRLEGKAKMQARWREQLASGEWTVQAILTSCQSWRKEAAQWLAELTRVNLADMPLVGSEAEQQRILDARKREFEESVRGGAAPPAPQWDEGENETTEKE